MIHDIPFLWAMLRHRCCPFLVTAGTGMWTYENIFNSSSAENSFHLLTSIKWHNVPFKRWEVTVHFSGQRRRFQELQRTFVWTHRSSSPEASILKCWKVAEEEKGWIFFSRKPPPLSLPGLSLSMPTSILVLR